MEVKDDSLLDVSASSRFFFSSLIRTLHTSYVWEKRDVPGQYVHSLSAVLLYPPLLPLPLLGAPLLVGFDVRLDVGWFLAANAFSVSTVSTVSSLDHRFFTLSSLSRREVSNCMVFSLAGTLSHADRKFSNVRGSVQTTFVITWIGSIVAPASLRCVAIVSIAVMCAITSCPGWNL
jgi:hypothetical protein